MNNIDQTLIETVEQNAQEALVAYLRETNAPEWVERIISGLRLLDQFEGQTDHIFYNIEMVSILNDLIKATWVHTEQMQIEVDAPPPDEYAPE